MRPPRHQVEAHARLSNLRRLAQRPAIKDNVCIAGNHHTVSRNCSGLQPGVLEYLKVRIAARQLIHARDDDLELNAQLAKDLAPLVRPGSEDYVHASSGNQISISRSADSSESDPWTML